MPHHRALVRPGFPARAIHQTSPRHLDKRFRRIMLAHDFVHDRQGIAAKPCELFPDVPEACLRHSAACCCAPNVSLSVLTTQNIPNTRYAI